MKNNLAQLKKTTGQKENSEREELHDIKKWSCEYKYYTELILKSNFYLFMQYFLNLQWT